MQIRKRCLHKLMPHTLVAVLQCQGLAHHGNACTTATAICIASTGSNVKAFNRDPTDAGVENIGLSVSHRYDMSKRSVLVVLTSIAINNRIKRVKLTCLTKAGAQLTAPIGG